MAVLFPVVAAFGLTSAILGSDKGLLRLPLIVLLALVFIAVGFYVAIPAGYQLAPR